MDIYEELAYLSNQSLTMFRGYPSLHFFPENVGEVENKRREQTRGGEGRQAAWPPVRKVCCVESGAQKSADTLFLLRKKRGTLV